jgi:sugar lactone lactonase YvrE
VLPDKRVAVFQSNDDGPGLLLFDEDGKRLGQFGHYPGAHGLTVVRDGMWLVDQKTQVVHKVGFDGKVLRKIDPPADDVIASAGEDRANYIPTWADELPDGRVVVADGYGTWRVYRYDADGNYLDFLDGTEGTGRFREPHGLAISPDGELWIGDRSNLRMCVYDFDGKLLRHSDTACHSPAAIAFHAGHAYVAEIAGSVKILDRDLNVLADVAMSPLVTPNRPGDGRGWYPAEGNRPEGYPNVDRAIIPPDRFHTPHGIAVDPAGNVYVGEWYWGGRVVKLAKA